MKGDVSELLFRKSKSAQVCRLFIQWLRKNKRNTTPRALGKWLIELQEGRVKAGIRYDRKNFYHTILRSLMTMGFVNKQVVYPRKVIYAPIIQPIPKTPPLLMTWWGVAYLIAEAWNRDIA